MNWFNSLSTFWKITIIIIIIIVLYLIWKKYLKNAFQKKQIDPSTIFLSNGTSVVITDSSQLPQNIKSDIEALAESIKADIYGANITHQMNLYKQASGLSDVEIDYLATYYKKQLTNGTSLYEDMDNELFSCVFQDCSGAKALTVKLEKTGNR